ncbi:MAG: hypothetical protein M3R29_03495 [Verrucomicrobiota bacterium]|nr:hypothetical protein [Verrucomicrobiota bacterium]
MQRFGRFALIAFEVAILSTLIIAARCANYQDVFVAGNVYFADADCYARMTRVRKCAQHPGMIVRHHNFENFPVGTVPHTTAPLDYLIVTLSILLRPITTHAVDLAGALISPLLAVMGGWFLWWWSRRMRFRYRWTLLILYAISPILVHGTEIGRPDHQALVILLVTIAICAEWMLRCRPSPRWAVVSGIAWGVATWVSVYEPFLLLALLVVIGVLQDRDLLFTKERRTGWIVFSAIILTALMIEGRIPSVSIFSSSETFRNWSRTIGELLAVSPFSPIWFRWAGYMIVIAPILVWTSTRKSTSKSKSKRAALPMFVIALLIATYGCTIWQARWAYFFVLIFAIALPGLLQQITSRLAVWVAFTLSIFPILRDWDEKLWPSETELARRIERRHEGVGLRELALNIQSFEMRAFLAPWWLSPSIAYWSGQPGIAGSSHESLDGIADSARFFLSEDPQKAREILENHKVTWIFSYDAERVLENSSALLGTPIPEHPLCRSLDRMASQAPRYLVFSAQNTTGKLFRVANNR